jgi:hypothetical protein
MHNLDYQGVLIQNASEYLKVMPFLKENGYTMWRGEVSLDDPPEEYPCILMAVDLNENVMFGIPERRLMYSTKVAQQNTINTTEFIELVKSYREETPKLPQEIEVSDYLEDAE